jgi:hypothetical protein
MVFRRSLELFRWSAAVLVMSGGFCLNLHGQALIASAAAPAPDAPTPSIEPVAPILFTSAIAISEHRFMDKQNRVLFLAAAALNGADFAVTRANLQSGGQELNPLVRPFGSSTAGLAVNFIGETASVITLSYFFHRTGHHKLERAVSIVNIGGSAGAVSYGLAHR